MLLLDIFSAYGGEFCEEDRNGCSEIQCFEGVECLDVSAPDVGAMCGECPEGYSGDGEKCFGKVLGTLYSYKPPIGCRFCIATFIHATNYRY